MEKLLLAIDTATRCASLALHDGARVRIEVTWETSRHTVELAPRIAGALAQVGASMNDLAGVAVSIGPGSFTGVRVGVAVAKGICLACGLPIYGVCSLDVIACAQPAETETLVAVVQAGRGRLCAVRYRRSNATWQIEGEPWLTTAQTLGKDWQETIWVCGELDATERHTLQTRLGKRVRLATPAASLRRAGYLAEIGWDRLRHGRADDLARLIPLYLQMPGGPATP